MSRFPKLSSFLVKSIAATPRTKMSTAKLHINEGKFTPAVLFILLTVLSIFSARPKWPILQITQKRVGF